MVQLNTAKFHIKNLDCANCAAKIERGLNKIDGIKEANVDFVNLILHVTTNDIRQVIDGVKRIDPSVELIPQLSSTKKAQSPDSTQYHPAKDIVLLVMATLLFAGELFIENSAGNVNLWLELAVVLTAYLLAGFNVIIGALKTLYNRTLFDEKVLMLIATLGAILIEAYSEAVGVMIFYKIGELLQEIAVSRSRGSIRGLLAARPEKAVVKTERGWLEVAPEEVNVGDEIKIKPGEKIPLDGHVTQGSSQIDTSPITGEFKPLTVRINDRVMAGQINQTGLLKVHVTKPFAQSSIARVMDLVENAAARKANTEKFITTFARYYTPFVVFMAAGIALIPPLFFSKPFETWIYRALVLLVISCPCALVISIPLGYFGGIGRASKSGILVKGSNFIDVLSGVKTVVFDKTGTLTKGVFSVNFIGQANGYSKEKLLEFAAAAEYHSTHPIATSILKAYEAAGGRINSGLITNHVEYSGEGVLVDYQGNSVMIGNDNLLHRKDISHDRCDFDTTVVHIVVNGQYSGYLMIGDQIKDDAFRAVDALHKEGIERVLMLTGDNHSTAQAVANELKLDDFYAGLLPEEKVSRFETIAAQYQKLGKIAFVGDGINDAPTLARADVGLAMGAMGSEAAIETADVVLMTDSPAKVAQAVLIAKQTRRIVWQNIVLAFSIKIFFIGLGAMGMASMWFAVFADMGTALLAVFNSTRILKKTKKQRRVRRRRKIFLLN